MAGYQYTVSLRIFHPTKALDHVTEVLGIEPGHSGLVRAPRTNSEGRPAPGKWPHSYWSARLAAGSWHDRDLPAALHACLDELATHQAFLAQLAEDGARLEFWIGWFFDEGNSGDAFAPELLARLAEFRIALHFDVYDHVAASDPRLTRSS